MTNPIQEAEKLGFSYYESKTHLTPTWDEELEMYFDEEPLYEVHYFFIEDDNKFEQTFAQHDGVTWSIHTRMVAQGCEYPRYYSCDSTESLADCIQMCIDAHQEWFG